MTNTDSAKKAVPLIAHELDINDPMAHENRAALEFLRSMSIGKVIAVVGSGTCTVYGYDSWSDFGKKISEFLIDLYENKRQKSSNEPPSPLTGC